MEQKNKFIYILPVMFGFFIMGFCDLVGISVTYAKEQFQWTETQAGFLPSMVFLWFFILSVPTAMLMNRIERKNTVLLSMLFTFAGMVLPFIDFSETSCYVAFALLGIGNTILQVSLNPLLANVVQGKGLTSSLTAGQFVKAISSFVGPLLAGYCSAALGNWALMFPIYAVVTLISSAWLFLTPIQREKVEGETSSFPATLKLLGDNKILLLFFGILCVVGLDVGMNTLTPKLLLERVPGISTESAGYGTSWYFAARTIGTFCGAFLLAKLSERGYFRINMIIAMIAVCGLWFATGQAAILTLVCIIAFAASSIFAVVYSMAIQARPEKANEISGLMITGVAGGAIAPPLMGICADAVGGQGGSVIIIAICTAYLLFCSYGIKVAKK